MPKPPLTVQNAAITTAAVEIKTLTVSGKQVTLAVFRQLLEEPLIRHDGTFAGQLWGTVNYHPDRCASAPEHWHVVWQDGDQLRRTAVSKVPAFDDEFWPDEGDAFITAWVFEFACAGQPPLYSTTLLRALTSRNGWAKIATRHGFTALVGLEQDETKAAAAACFEVVQLESQARSFEDGEPPEWLTRQLREARERVDASAEQLDKIVSQRSSEELHDEFMAAVDREQGRREQHHAARAVIAQLPQLFIAV